MFQQLVVVFQPTDAVLYNAKDKPCTAASLAIFSGDESMRQFYRKYELSSSLYVLPSGFLAC